MSIPIYRDWQQSVLESIVLENIGERGSDHRAKTVCQQSPGGVFARGSAAEIFPNDQDLRSISLGFIQSEIRLGLSIPGSFDAGYRCLT